MCASIGALDRVTTALRMPFSAIHDKLPTPERQTLPELVKHENGAFVSLKNDSIIHVISATQAQQMATIISESAAPIHGITVPLLAAWVRGESRFDAFATNHNKPKAKPGETPEETCRHTDYGAAQINGSEFPGYADLKDMPWYEQVKCAYDPTWAIPAMVSTIANLLGWAEQLDKTIREIGFKPEYGDNYIVAAGEAYNKGKSGSAIRAILPYAGTLLAVDMNGMVVRREAGKISNDVAAHTMRLTSGAMVDPSFSYGLALVGRQTDYASRLGLAA